MIRDGIRVIELSYGGKIYFVNIRGWNSIKKIDNINKKLFKKQNN